MRGRKPRPLTIADTDQSILWAVAHSRRLAWFQVQHSRIVLAVAAGEPVHSVAARLECDRATVWRVCRRYEQGGLQRLLSDEPRVGRPQEISPPATGSDRRAGLPGAHRPGVTYHPLEQPGFGAPGGRRRHRERHQPAHGPADPARGGLAAAPDPLLEDLPAGWPLQGARREGAV